VRFAGGPVRGDRVGPRPRGLALRGAYAAAQARLARLFKPLALEGAAHGISARAVCPCTYARRWWGRIAHQATARGLPEDCVDVILAPQAVKRLIEPDAAAATVAVLLGPDGRAFTRVPVNHGSEMECPMTRISA
jgi:3-hydroxybutyrate dehydrogenase